LQDDIIRFQHMLDAVNEILEFTDGKSRSDLDDIRVLALALVKLLEIIGEAASGISKVTKDEHPELPWKQMIGMRNRLIHGYFDIDLDIVWQTVDMDLPPLKIKLESILRQVENSVKQE